MLVRHINISNFRGIRQLKWNVDSAFILLVGPGDSGKSAILDAIDLTLASRMVTFDDTDFFDGKTDEPICIQITVGKIPRELLTQERFGDMIRGWNSQSGIRDEPATGDETVLTIQLRVDSSLEPEWTVVNDREPEGARIRFVDREHLGVNRIGVHVDQHLGWGRGSLLARMSGKIEELPAIFATAARTLREELVKVGSIAELGAASTKAQELAVKLGVPVSSVLKAAMDPRHFSLRSGLLSLHDGAVPSRSLGTGSRRLLALALELAALENGGIALVDEVEHGLEPHRLRHLISQLKAPTLAGHGQVIVTTHSPVVIVECDAIDIHLVRNNNGQVQVTRLTSDLQDVVRRAPDALLAPSVIVCEGRTEQGFCRRLGTWNSEQGKPPFSHLGIVPVDGCSNTTGPRTASILSALGYRVCFFGDSDKEPNPSEPEMTTAGVTVVLWADRLCLEQRLAADLPWAQVLRLLYFADQSNPDSVRQHIRNALGDPNASWVTSPFEQWSESTLTRYAIGTGATKGGWFKNIPGGEQLGGYVVDAWKLLSGTDVEKKVTALQSWVDA